VAVHVPVIDTALFALTTSGGDTTEMWIYGPSSRVAPGGNSVNAPSTATKSASPVFWIKAVTITLPPISTLVVERPGATIVMTGPLGGTGTGLFVTVFDGPDSPTLFSAVT